MAYEILAYYYDELMEDMPYSEWVDLVNKYVNGKKILDIACGSGTLTVALSKEGYQIDACDLSNEMLFVAEQKSKINHEKIHFFEADMLDLKLEPIYDGITIFVDSICYILEEEQVLQVFKNVYQGLKENGVFLFDAHTPFKIDEIFDGYEEGFDMGEYSYLWNSKKIAENTVRHEFKFIIDDEEYVEEHIQRTQGKDKYVELLQLAQFEIIEIIEEDDRVFFVAKKTIH